ncbi:MAG: NADH-quinone oxidoreductase subunit C [Firmicutes bacterium]|nr:NADH-quinone oxidoreductase subunit C [Bacillota bacterium]MBQ3286718.1 NADH-quinone oxidoreductase subunit C [Bacillota bacterium]MBQ6535765.1 NADH-quinone oxidoreductase subunit C [Bacillota bacterium]MBQ6607159.1 NADH-quinone oxidoreductase subunit C [Bacillota bacterium]MBR0376061.1 NADH-quinone oxidoreductase subunit C [Bacillota bacterium]
MQKYTKTVITADELPIIAQRMRDEQRPLAMIHGHVDKEGKNVLHYDFDMGETIESYVLEDVTSVPSLVSIYDAMAAWPETELTELMGIEFTGLDISHRLFMPDNLLSGEGHIIVTPLSELRAKNVDERED